MRGHKNYKGFDLSDPSVYFLFCRVVCHERSEAFGTSFSRAYPSFYDSYGKFNPILLKVSQLNRTISGRNLVVGFYK